MMTDLLIAAALVVVTAAITALWGCWPLFTTCRRIQDSTPSAFGPNDPAVPRRGDFELVA